MQVEKSFKIDEKKKRVSGEIHSKIYKPPESHSFNASKSLLKSIVIKQGAPKNVYFSPLKDKNKGIDDEYEIEEQTTVKKTLLVSKFYSEGDFFLKDAQPSPAQPIQIFNGESKVTPIQKARRFEYPMQKILEDNNDNVPQITQNLIYENEKESRDDIISKSSMSTRQKYRAINDFSNVKMSANILDSTPVKRDYSPMGPSHNRHASSDINTLL